MSITLPPRALPIWPLLGTLLVVAPARAADEVLDPPGQPVSSTAASQPSTGDAPEGIAAPAVPAVPSRSGPLRLMVPPLRPLGVDEALAAALTDILTIELEKYDAFTVISREDIKTQLEQQALAQLLGCEDETCVADLGQLAAADKIAFGSVSTIGATHAISISLIDVRSGKIDVRSNQTLSGDRDRLIAAIQAVAFNLVSSARGELEGDAISVGTVEDLRVAQQPRHLDFYLSAGPTLYVDLDGAGLLGAPAFALRTGVDANVLPWLLLGVRLGLDSVTAEHSQLFYLGDLASGSAARNRLVGQLALNTVTAMAQVTLRKSYGLVLPYLALAAGGGYHDLRVGDERLEPISDEDTLPINTSDLRNEREGTSGFAAVIEGGAGVELLFFKWLALCADFRLFKTFHDMKISSQVSGLTNTPVREQPFQAIQGVSIQVGLAVQL